MMFELTYILYIGFISGERNTSTKNHVYNSIHYFVMYKLLHFIESVPQIYLIS